MEPKLVLLKLYLDNLEIPDDITTVDDRKRVQKAVYLAQRAGVNLGYRFGWYRMGPYSPELTRDYYELAECLADGDKEHERMELRQPVRQRLRQACPLMSVPEDVDLPQEGWLEVLASVDYLRKVRRLDSRKASDVLLRQKPQLAPFFSRAEQALQDAGLL
jgi:hypothetical protein